MGCRQFMQHPLANAYTGNNQMPRVQQFRERREHDRSHAHDLGAIASHAKAIDAALRIEPQDLPQHLPQAAEIQSIETRHAWARSNSSQRLRIPSTGHSSTAADLHRSPRLRAQNGTDVRLQGGEGLGYKRSGEIKLLHQANRAERKGESAIDFAPAEKTHLQAAAAEIENQPGRKASYGNREYRLAYQPSFFRRADGDEFNACFAVDTRDQGIAIGGLTQGAGGDRGIFIHFVAVEQASEMLESLDGPRHCARVQSLSREDVVPQPNRPARAGELAYLRGRTGARHDCTDRVRSRIQRGNHQWRWG